MNSRSIIQRVSPDQLQKVIRQYLPRDLFPAREGHKWIAVDNSTDGDAWSEEFPCKRQVVRWLRGEFDVC